MKETDKNKTSLARKIYTETLIELAKKNKNIYFLDADLGGLTYGCIFKKVLPHQYINVGNAEQNLMGIAAGLASIGKIPFANTFAIFASMRVAEQIRFIISYTNLNVRITGIYSGLSSGKNGPSHHCENDFALLRSIPNMTVIEPADSISVKKMITQSIKWNGPIYFRLGRNPVPIVYGESDSIKIGRANVLKSGNDITIIACGQMVYNALTAADKLSKIGISAEVIDNHTIKPIDKETILRSAKKTGRILTVEEHNVYGGLGGSISEFLSENYPVKMKIIGINDIFTDSDEEDLLREKFGLNAENIISNSRLLIGQDYIIKGAN